MVGFWLFIIFQLFSNLAYFIRYELFVSLRIFAVSNCWSILNRPSGHHFWSFWSFLAGWGGAQVCSIFTASVCFLSNLLVDGRWWYSLVRLGRVQSCFIVTSDLSKTATSKIWHFQFSVIWKSRPVPTILSDHYIAKMHNIYWTIRVHRPLPFTTIMHFTHRLLYLLKT